MEYTTAAGHKLYYEIHGPQAASAPAVVLLHHGLGAVSAWRAQIPALSAAGYRTLVYDRWGYGRSDPRPELDLPYFGADLSDLEDLLDAVGMPRVALVGHSDGGSIGMYFAACHPERVTCLVAIASHIYVEPKMEAGIRGVHAAYTQDESFRRGLQRVHGDKAERVFFNWYDGWARPESLDWDMRPQLANLRCPALIVQGENDEHATPQHASDCAASLPGAEVWLVPGAQHMLPQEQPELLNPRLLAFLERYAS